MGKSFAFGALCVAMGALVVSPAAQAQWPVNGLHICQIKDDNSPTAICSDGINSMFLGWAQADYLGHYSSAHVEKLSCWGDRVWSVGVSEGKYTSANAVVSDGAGGVFVAWTARDAAGAQWVGISRITAAGTLTTFTHDIPVGAFQGPVVLASGGVAGGAILAWRENGDIRAQKYDADGNVLWTWPYVIVCNDPVDQSPSAILPDGTGGAYIGWRDNRTGAYRAYVQRMQWDGTPAWTPNGVAICPSSGAQEAPRLVGDGGSGVIVAWQDGRAGNKDVYAQRLDGTGAAQWAAEGVPVCTAAGDQIYPGPVSDGAGGAIVGWMDARGGAYNVYAQRIDHDGVALWAAGGVAVCPQTAVQNYYQIASDALGGAILVWADARGGVRDIYAQRIDASGIPLWDAGGALVCGAAGDQSGLVMSPDAGGGAMLAWRDMREGDMYLRGDVYAMWVREGIPPVATLLQEYSVEPANGTVEIAWTLSSLDPDARFSVLRASSGGLFEELPSIDIVKNGLSFSASDATAEPGVTYRYRVDIVSASRTGVLFETEGISTPVLPLTLYQNHPNPFNPTTAIGYYLPVAGPVTLDVYDSTGRLISRLLDGVTQERGTHEVAWRGVDGAGRTVGSGVYFYRLTAGKATISKKMVLLR